jgi:hypothetical protein
MMLNLPIDELIQISAALFGLIFGVIFLSDGWYATSEEPGFLGNSPKIRGLLFLLGGSIIPILTDLFSPAGSDARGYATVVYAIVLGFTTFIGVLILALYAFMVSANRIHDLVPSRRRLKICVDALPFAFIAVRKGSTRFYEELNSEYSRIRKLRRQREDTLTLFTGIYNAMVQNNIRHISGVEDFAKFVTSYLKYFLEDFLVEYSDEHIVYRACIYFHDRDNKIEDDGDKKLYFFVGVDPKRRTTFSKSAFDIENSFAGWVLRNSTHGSLIHSSIRGEFNEFDGEAIPFQARTPTGPYKSVVAYAIQPLIRRNNSQPRMVLCIDCSTKDLGVFSEFSEDKEYIESVIPFLCAAFATAQASMDVSSSEDLMAEHQISLASWIKANNYTG